MFRIVCDIIRNLNVVNVFINANRTSTYMVQLQWFDANISNIVCWANWHVGAMGYWLNRQTIVRTQLSFDFDGPTYHIYIWKIIGNVRKEYIMWAWVYEGVNAQQESSLVSIYGIHTHWQKDIFILTIYSFENIIRSLHVQIKSFTIMKHRHDLINITKVYTNLSCSQGWPWKHVNFISCPLWFFLRMNVC